LYWKLFLKKRKNRNIKNFGEVMEMKKIKAAVLFMVAFIGVLFFFLLGAIGHFRSLKV